MLGGILMCLNLVLNELAGCIILANSTLKDQGMPDILLVGLKGVQDGRSQRVIRSPNSDKLASKNPRSPGIQLVG